MGLTGKGIKVAVIDTGIENNHAAFRGRIQVSYNYYPQEEKNTNSHGTHAAGIIGGKDGTITGVAPEVTFGSYRGMGNDGRGYSDVLMRALEQAGKDGMDVINMSLGSNGWEDSPYANGITNLVKKGVFVIAAAGNDGSSGLFQIGSPGVLPNVIGVTSATMGKTVRSQKFVNFGTTKVAVRFAPGSEAKSDVFFLYFVSSLSNNDDPQEGCNPLPMQTFSQQIVLVRLGGCSTEKKINVLSTAGARAILFYGTKQDEERGGSLGATLRVPVMILNYEQGSLFKKRTSRNGIDRLYPVYEEGGFISDFSSWGPSGDMLINPQIAAPVS
jgi:subtilisin family serine protease